MFFFLSFFSLLMSYNSTLLDFCQRVTPSQNLEDQSEGGVGDNWAPSIILFGKWEALKDEKQGGGGGSSLMKVRRKT